MEENHIPKDQNIKKHKKTPNFLRRVLLILLSVVLVVGAVSVVVFRDKLNIDSIRRYFAYRSLSVNDSGKAESFEYDGSLKDTFATLDGDLLVCSRNTISLYSGSGQRYVNQSVSMENPVVDVNGSMAVVYDAGGSQLFVVGKRQLLWQGEELTSILSAHVSRNGYLTVVTQSSGYRGTVTVYNDSYEPQLTVNLSSSFVMDAALNDNGSTLALLTVGQEGGIFTSKLNYYSMSSAQSGQFVPDKEISLGNDVILSLRHGNNAVWALGEQSLYITDRQGELLSHDWSNRHIKRFTLGSDRFAAALLGRYRAGSQAELCVVTADGQSKTLDCSEQVLSLSAAGRYLAVLTGDRLDIYTEDLELYRSLDGTQGARTVLMLENGSAILISSDSASYYIP